MAPATPSTGPPVRVGFAAEVQAIRQPREDEMSVMSYFTKHASRCTTCVDPYAAYRQDIPLCERGTAFAKDVANYIYVKGGKPFSVIDRRDGDRVQIQIPSGMEAINLLVKAFDRGLVLQTRQKQSITETDAGKVERSSYEEARKDSTSPRKESWVQTPFHRSSEQLVQEDDYRAKIEALRQEFGSNWLSALGEQNSHNSHTMQVGRGQVLDNNSLHHPVHHPEERRYRQGDVEIVEIAPLNRRERMEDNISVDDRGKSRGKERARWYSPQYAKGSLHYRDEKEKMRRRQYEQEPVVIIAEPSRRSTRLSSRARVTYNVDKNRATETPTSEFTGGTPAELASQTEVDNGKSWADKLSSEAEWTPKEDKASETVQVPFDQEKRSNSQSMTTEEFKAAGKQRDGSKSQVRRGHSLLEGEQSPSRDSSLKRARGESKDDTPFLTREDSAIESDRTIQDITWVIRKGEEATRIPCQSQSPELELEDAFGDYSWERSDGEHDDDSKGSEQRENSGVEAVRESKGVLANAATNGIVPHSDSGYASGGVVCTAETQTQLQALSAFGPSNFEDNELNKEESVGQQDLTEIASVLSDYDEIGSRAEIRKSPEHLAAEDQIRAFFAQHTEIEALCKDLLPQMGRERFVRNVRRLLKSYYKAQVKLARSNIEHSTIFLLRSNFQRERIALSIADRLDPKDEIRLDAEKDLQEITDRTARVQEWLKSQKAFALDDDRAVTDATSPTLELSDDDEPEEIMGDEHYQFPHIDRMKDFLGKSSPFRSLVIDLHLLLIPTRLQSLARTLLAIPSDSIDMTGEYHPAVADRIKNTVEDVTRTQWNWWPLNQCIKPPINGHKRITWKCHCRRRLWQDVSNEHIDQFRRLISIKGSQTVGAHICAQLFARPQTQQSVSRKVAMLGRPPFKTVPSSHTSPHNQTPTQAAPVARQASPSQQSSSSSSVPSSRMSSTSSLGHAPSSATSIGSLSSSINIPGNEDFVLLGINGTRRTLDLVHIKTTKENDDDLKFFDALLRSYASLRGTMRRWFSIWQLTHCDFVKFKKIMPDRVVLVGTDLPSCPIDYSYDPRPPNPLAPGVDKHMWELALLRPCMRPFSCVGLPFCILSCFHDCGPNFLAGSNIFLPRIPQKHSRWLIETPEMDYAWGVIAKEEPYMIILVIYHLVMFAGPFGFWAWWLTSQHAQTGVWDLQNAAVPATVVGVLVSLFWSAAQPLRVFDAR